MGDKCLKTLHISDKVSQTLSGISAIPTIEPTLTFVRLDTTTHDHARRRPGSRPIGRSPREHPYGTSWRFQRCTHPEPSSSSTVARDCSARAEVPSDTSSRYCRKTDSMSSAPHILSLHMEDAYTVRCSRMNAAGMEDSGRATPLPFLPLAYVVHLCKLVFWNYLWPASRTKTLCLPPADKRFASTRLAVPPPMMTKSYSGGCTSCSSSVLAPTSCAVGYIVGE